MSEENSEVTAFSCMSPAFPVSKDSKYNGMKLRDYFAAKAMQGILAREGYSHVDKFAEKCFLIADAMLEAREK